LLWKKASMKFKEDVTVAAEADNGEIDAWA